MHRFGDLEALVIDRLWARTLPMTSREVRDALAPSRVLAYNTVQTVLDNLYKKGWLLRQPHGRAFAYSATVSREEYCAGRLRDALDEVDDPAVALLRFVETMSSGEATALRAALENYERDAATEQRSQR